MLHRSMCKSLKFPREPCWTEMRSLGWLSIKMSLMQPWKALIGFKHWESWVMWWVTSAPDLALLFVMIWLGEMPTEHHEAWEDAFFSVESLAKSSSYTERTGSQRGLQVPEGELSVDGAVKWGLDSAHNSNKVWDSCDDNVRALKERMTQGSGKASGLVTWPWPLTSFAYFSIRI